MTFKFHVKWALHTCLHLAPTWWGLSRKYRAILQCVLRWALGWRFLFWWGLDQPRLLPTDSLRWMCFCFAASVLRQSPCTVVKNGSVSWEQRSLTHLPHLIRQPREGLVRPQPHMQDESCSTGIVLSTIVRECWTWSLVTGMWDYGIGGTRSLLFIFYHLRGWVDEF